MALIVRIRRAAALASSILKDCSFSSTHSSRFPLSNPRFPIASHLESSSLRIPLQISSSSFHSSIPFSIRRVDSDQGSKIPEDEILFEGCDYNHWLITMDFPKDPKPSPEEMVETYVQTLAKVVGSVEEAKKKIYACSTTTYNGFQAVMSEEMSEKFRGLPGVVFILPDSYIDPVNKEYGGDKYDNGVITPRPPPIHYGRQGRYGDRNRRYDQPRYDRQDGRSYGPPGQDGRSYGPPGQDGRSYGPPGQDGRSYGPPGQDGRSYSPPRQDGRSYGPPGQDGRSYGPPGQDGRSYGPPGQDGRSYVPPGQDGRSYGTPGQDGRSYVPPGQDGRSYGPPGQDGRSYGPPGQDGRSYGPPGQDRRSYVPPEQDGRSYGPPGQDRRSYVPPEQDGRSYGPPSPSGTLGQDGRSYGPPRDIQQGYSPMQQGNPQMQEGQPHTQQGYGGNYGQPQNYGPPLQEGRSYGQPGGTQQGYSPIPHGNSPQTQPENQQYSRKDPVQDGGTYAQQQNYGAHGDKKMD